MSLNNGTKKTEEKQLVVFKVGGEEFGVEISQVREIVRVVEITRMPKAPKFIKGVVNLRGHIVTVIDLAERFDMQKGDMNDSTRIMVLEIGESIIGMIVDEVMEVLRLPGDAIENTPALIETAIHEKYLKGVGKIGDRLLILLDLQEMLSPEELAIVENIKEEEKK